MSKSVTVTIAAQVVGDGVSYQFTSPLTISPSLATPIQSAVTVNGNLLVAVPAGVTYGALIVPPSGSVVAKTFAGANADVGITSWTAQAIFVPVTTGNFAVKSTAVETLEIIWV